MFLESSRYFKQKQVNVTTKDGRQITAVSLRRLPLVEGTPLIVKGNDKLDMIAQNQYDNPTMFWHIADANTELKANDLVKETDYIKTIKVPDQ
jgi:phage terminase Nu1 subunit (DNA packaging protein)